MSAKFIDAGSIQFDYARRYFKEFISRRPKVAEVLKEVPTPALLIDLEGVKSRFLVLRWLQARSWRGSCL